MAGAEPAAHPPLTKLGWTPVIEQIGLLPGSVAVEPGPTSLQATATVTPAYPPSAIATADLDWPLTIAPDDDSIPEGEPVSYQIAHRRLDLTPAAAMAPVPGTSIRTDRPGLSGSPIFIPASIARLPPVGRLLHIDRNDIAMWTHSLPDGEVGEFVALTCLGESANLAHGRLRPSLIHLPPSAGSWS
jgi:hypothetical protein